MKYPKITVVNTTGSHGHFLRYTLDKFCSDTPVIHKLPFNHLGNSHVDIDYSGQFIFDEGDDLNIENENIIFINVLDEILYFERVWLHRAGDSNADLYSEQGIIDCLTHWGSTFPAFCKSKGISIQEGYTYGFMNMDQQGSVVRNKERFKKICSKNNIVYNYNINNFFTVDAFESSIANIGKFFNMSFDTTGIAELHKEFCERNEILKTQRNVDEYLSGNKDVNLDIIQKAYIDALKK